ncbi:MAG TPA: RNA polymerase sigma factor [Candidatus Kapabacteria bacterium]|nr:RNA polymerase sigma factor [Candidatus Kapabacteria bacterium]
MEEAIRNLESVAQRGAPHLFTSEKPTARSVLRSSLRDHAFGKDSAAETFHQFLMGDNDAFERLFEQYNARLFRYCFKLVKDRAAAEDLTEDMWLKLIEKRSMLTEKENVLAFLYRVLRNLAINYLGSGRVRNEVAIEHANEEAERESRTDLADAVLECIEHLAPESKELVILHYYSGFSFKEIAAAWQMEPEAIWTRASRARQQLKSLLESRQKLD